MFEANRRPRGLAAVFHRVVSNGFFSCRSEGVAVAFFDADEIGAAHAVLVTVEENQRPARPVFGLNVRVIFQHFKFGCHKEQL